ncbi:Putative pentatricopeptide repeat-containing protein [Arachis hypogaea]|nr:Putative pentatricopeptide repeat-containing protein [Arachis hypogaea]
MPHKNVITWTTLISANLRNGYLPKAFDMFNHMREVGESPNEYTLSALPRACADPGLRDVGLQLHGVGSRDLIAWNVMVSGFAQVGKFGVVKRLFSEMRRGVHGLVFKFGADVDMVVGRTLVDLYAEFRDIDSCRKIFDHMEEKDSLLVKTYLIYNTFKIRNMKSKFQIVAPLEAPF